MFFFCPALFGVEGISYLLERWFTVENALYHWKNDAVNSTDANFVIADSAAGDMAAESAEILYALEQFRVSLDEFTGSLLFIQYEGTGLLPEQSGIAVCQMTDALTAAVERAVIEGNGSTALTAEVESIRQTLFSWSRIDSMVSSQVFSRFVYIFGVFLFSVILLIAAMLLIYQALRRSQIQEQDSADFSRTTMLIQEKERSLISAELHDTVLQDMGRLLQISKETDTSPGHSLAELAQRIMVRTRDICRTLMPPDFSRLVLTDSLVQLCADFKKRTSVECRTIIASDFSANRLSPQMQLQLYRIVQESLSNIEKHAEAGEVTLTARNKEDKALLICVTDDGAGLPDFSAGRTEASSSDHSRVVRSGFLPDQNAKHLGRWPAGGLGIRGMYQRAAMLGASLSFISEKGSGLTVRLEVPLS